MAENIDVGAAKSANIRVGNSRPPSSSSVFLLVIHAGSHAYTTHIMIISPYASLQPMPQSAAGMTCRASWTIHIHMMIIHGMAIMTMTLIMAMAMTPSQCMAMVHAMIMSEVMMAVHLVMIKMMIDMTFIWTCMVNMVVAVVNAGCLQGSVEVKAWEFGQRRGGGGLCGIFELRNGFR